MYTSTCQVYTDSNSCVAFHTLLCPLSFLFVKTPEFKEWYSIDTSFFGSKWILSIRGDASSREYIVWNSYNTGNMNTSKIYLDSSSMANVPPMCIFAWAVCTLSNLITTKWTRSLCNPFAHTGKVKSV
jgi:hypothetical protein